MSIIKDEENHEGFVRSRENPGAVVNTDNYALESYRRQRKFMAEQNAKINQINRLSDEMTELKNELSTIKELLIKVINK